MSLEVTALKVVFEDDDTQETLVYSGQTTLASCKFCKLFPKNEETLLNKNWGGGGEIYGPGHTPWNFCAKPL